MGVWQGFFKDWFRTAQSSNSMASAEHEPITALNGGLGAVPPVGVQVADPQWGSGGFS